MPGKNVQRTAKSAKLTDKLPRQVVLIAYDGVEPLDITGPSSVFGRANEYHPGSYDVVYASADGGKVTGASGLVLADLRPLRRIAKPIDTLLIAGGNETGIRDAIGKQNIPAFLAKAAPTTRRVGSVCTGAFILAMSGLLDGRRAVTHWASCDRLEEISPKTKVDPDAIYVRDGNVFTSAGVTAGIDAALALVEEDLGRGTAAEIARSMVLFLRRSGGQSQYSRALMAQSEATDRLGDLITWIANHLSTDLSVPILARRAGMSERSFCRKFKAETGYTPAAYVRAARLESARHLLETTNWPAKRIADRSGFGSVDSLEYAIRTGYGTTPMAIRNAYGVSGAR